MMRRAALAATLLAVPAFVGCGSTATKTVTAHVPSTAAKSKQATGKAHFIAQADSVCRAAGKATERFRKRLNEVQREPAGPAGKSLTPILRGLIASERASVAELQSLPEPAGDSKTIATWLAALRDSINDQSNVTDAFATG